MSRIGSSQAGSRRVAIAKPKNDVYVVLLLIAVCAMLVACVLLALEMNDYQWTVTPKVSRISPSLEVPAVHSPVLAGSAGYRTIDGWSVPCERLS